MIAITKSYPEPTLTEPIIHRGGRNQAGRVTARHRGGEPKRRYRFIDFKRDKFNVPGVVTAIEYDPNRHVRIALVVYTDGEKRYILCPNGLKVNDRIVSGEHEEPKTGNCLPLKSIPIGTGVHNIEIHPGKGGQMIRGAGTVAMVLASEGGFTHVKLPSGEVRKFDDRCMATVGQLSNVEWSATPIGSAGRARRMGHRPKVRGTAQHPDSHPHGGGEGRSGEGMHPKTPWGKPARGLKTRKKNKYSNRYTVSRRK